MIITRTPFRISFFGGGTDYPSWYLNNGGSVLSAAIDKYCYISLRYLPPFFEHRIRVVYSKVELCQIIDEIQHPAVRETLRFLDFNRGVEIHHDGDLPARSGMGSSSSFTVGLLHALYALRGMLVSKKQLAMESIHIEQNMIKETVGSQDQVAAAFGGLNHIKFNKNGEIDVCPIPVSIERREELCRHLMLFYTGIRRTASNVADTYVRDLNDKQKLMLRMNQMVEQGLDILQSNRSICEFGELLHDAWVAKQCLSDKVSNSTVDSLYDRSRKNGAIGGKITGAGGGGFLLLFVPPPAQRQLREGLKNLIHVPFQFEFHGSQINLYDPPVEDYSEIELDRDQRKICSCREMEAII
ncbi:MAG: kinase [Desulfatirhabdiaceae bacterium]